MIVFILPLAFTLLLVLLYAERQKSERNILMVKPALSALFILTLFSFPHGASMFFSLILSAMCFCWLGDVFLVFSFRKRFFALGLLSFLFGHILYAAAFFWLGGWQVSAWIALPLIGLTSGYAFYSLRPFLGTMFRSVIAYVVIISLMVLAASSLAGNAAWPASSRMLILFGALSFYFSDLFVARQRFVYPAFINRLIGLPLYYAGQFLIAFGTLGMVLL